MGGRWRVSINGHFGQQRCNELTPVATRHVRRHTAGPARASAPKASTLRVRLRTRRLPARPWLLSLSHMLAPVAAKHAQCHHVQGRPSLCGACGDTERQGARGYGNRSIICLVQVLAHSSGYSLGKFYRMLRVTDMWLACLLQQYARTDHITMAIHISFTKRPRT